MTFIWSGLNNGTFYDASTLMKQTKLTSKEKQHTESMISILSLHILEFLKQLSDLRMEEDLFTIIYKTS